MTRIIIYSSALVAFVAATAMTVASIAIPKWVSYSVTTPRGDTFTKHVGLQKSCSSLDTPPCRNFPSAELCRDSERYFCSMWRTVGFMAFLATILSLACLVSFVVIMRGGKYERERGWPFTSGLLVLIATFELTIISIVAYLYDHDDQFAVPGWKLDASWYLTAVSASLCISTATALAASAYLLPPEEGYEPLNEVRDAH